MTASEELMPEAYSPEDEKFEEEWLVIMNTKGQYTLSKIQARILQQAIATGNRGVVMFQTFAISIPYIAEFYLKRRFLKNTKLLSEKATEEEYKPIDPEKFKKWRKEVYKKIGKPIPKGKKVEEVNK